MTDEDSEPISNFTDSVQPDSSQAPEQERTEIDFSVKIPEMRGYDDFAERDLTFSFDHPVANVEELHRTKHLAAHRHEDKRDQWAEEPLANDGGTLYDITILDVAPQILRIEGIDLEELEALDEYHLPAPRILALFLRRARGLTHVSEITNYLKDAKHVIAKLNEYAADEDDWDASRSKRTYRRAEKNLKAALSEIDATEADFDNAVTRAVYAVYRNGVCPPDHVAEEYGFATIEPPFDQSDVDPETKRQALRDWVARLFDDTMQAFTLNRTNPTYDMLSHLGMLATAALTDAGLRTTSDVTLWDHPPDKIPSGSGFPQRVEELLEDTDLPSMDTAARYLPRRKFQPLNAQFDAINADFLEFANQYQFFDDPVSIAIDIYRIDYHGDYGSEENLPLTIDGPSKHENDVTQQFTFVLAGIIDTQAMFALGTRMISENDQYPDALSGLLSAVPEFIEIDTVLVDAEMMSEKIVTILDDAGKDWIVSAPERGLVENLYYATPTNWAGYLDGGMKKLCGQEGPDLKTIAYPTNEVPNAPTVRFTKHQLESRDFTNMGDNMDLTEMVDTTSTDQASGESNVTEQATDSESDEPDGSDATVVPLARDEFDDLASKSGVGKCSRHATYYTNRPLPERSAFEIRLDYMNRWTIEAMIDRLKNDFMPSSGDKTGILRLYYAHLAAVFFNWHTIIQRMPSTERGVPMPEVTHQEMLKAIQHVAFDPDREKDTTPQS